MTFEAKKQARYGRWIFQRNGCKGSCGHVEGEVAACNLVGTVDGDLRRRPVVQRGSSATCHGTESPVTVDFATKPGPLTIRGL